MKYLLAAVLAVALFGCDGGSTSDVAQSGVGIVAQGCAGTTREFGSGIAVGLPGRVVTTAHTVAGATSVTIVDSLGTEFSASVVSFDKDADLALLNVPGLTSPPLDLGRAELGDARAIVWSPDNGVRSVSVMITRRLNITIEDIYVEDEVRRSGFELVGDISVGDSGGAIVDSSGDVVGIIYARSRMRPQTAFATDDDELRRLFNEQPLDATDRCQ